jgi:hypothetical protein
VVAKLVIACAMLFTSSLFFFQNVNEFWYDLLDINPFPVIFFAGIIFVCIYIGFLVSRIEDNALHRADKFDLAYKIIFSLLMIYISIRSFFIEPYLEVDAIMISILIFCGVVNWCTPRLVDNDNEEF